MITLGKLYLEEQCLGQRIKSLPEGQGCVCGAGGQTQIVMQGTLYSVLSHVLPLIKSNKNDSC